MATGMIKNNMRTVDIDITTGSSTFGTYYYGDNYTYNRNNVLLACVIGAGSNRYAVCMLMDNAVRVFCDTANNLVKVRLLLK